MIRLKIREIADSQRLNMSKLSRRADVSYNTIQNIYKDPYKDIEVSTLKKIADALGVGVSDLIEEVEEGKK